MTSCEFSVAGVTSCEVSLVTSCGNEVESREGVAAEALLLVSEEEFVVGELLELGLEQEQDWHVSELAVANIKLLRIVHGLWLK